MVFDDLSDSNLKLLLLGSQLVKLFDQLDILLEDPSILLSMLFGFFGQFLLQSCHVSLDLCSLLIVNLINIRCSRLIHSFIQDPCPVQADDSFFELFVA